MAGFTRMYVIGSEGGFMGADGVNGIQCQILVGESSRQWLEPRYFDSNTTPLGQLKSIVPEAPDHPDMLLDAVIAYLPHHFQNCPSMSRVSKELGTLDRLDFDACKEAIPAAWQALREEARPIFKQIGVWEANLVAVAH